MDDTYDFAIIGAGAAGEAAAYLARKRGASVAVIDRDLYGRSCPFWACMPSKALLHAASVHAAGGEYDWPRASARRDYMISREGTEYPSDAGHVSGLEGAGAVVIRGDARIAGPGLVSVSHEGQAHVVHARNIVLAVGSSSKILRSRAWTRSRPGRTARPPPHESSPRASWSWGPGPPAWRWPRSSLATGWPRP